MGRTLHYRLLAEKPVDAKTWRKIKSVQSAMNERFTWTCEYLKLDPVNEEDRRFYGLTPDEPSEPPVQGWGFTKVAYDEWNALLVVCFVRWVSKILPDVIVKLNDEGNFITAGSLILEGGKERLDGARVASAKAYLQERGLQRELSSLGRAADWAERYGVFYARFMALDYADRKEIAALGIPGKELAVLSLGEVTERIRFPWEEQKA